MKVKVEKILNFGGKLGAFVVIVLQWRYSNCYAECVEPSTNSSNTSADSNSNGKSDTLDSNFHRRIQTFPHNYIIGTHTSEKIQPIIRILQPQSPQTPNFFYTEAVIEFPQGKAYYDRYNNTLYLQRSTTTGKEWVKQTNFLNQDRIYSHDEIRGCCEFMFTRNWNFRVSHFTLPESKDDSKDLFPMTRNMKVMYHPSDIDLDESESVNAKNIQCEVLDKDKFVQADLIQESSGSRHDPSYTQLVNSMYKTVDLSEEEYERISKQRTEDFRPDKNQFISKSNLKYSAPKLEQNVNSDLAFNKIESYSKSNPGSSPGNKLNNKTIVNASNSDLMIQKEKTLEEKEYEEALNNLPAGCKTKADVENFEKLIIEADTEREAKLAEIKNNLQEGHKKTEEYLAYFNNSIPKIPNNTNPIERPARAEIIVKPIVTRDVVKPIIIDSKNFVTTVKKIPPNTRTIEPIIFTNNSPLKINLTSVRIARKAAEYAEQTSAYLKHVHETTNNPLPKHQTQVVENAYEKVLEYITPHLTPEQLKETKEHLFKIKSGDLAFESIDKLFQRASEIRAKPTPSLANMPAEKAIIDSSSRQRSQEAAQREEAAIQRNKSPLEKLTDLVNRAEKLFENISKWWTNVSAYITTAIDNIKAFGKFILASGKLVLFIGVAATAFIILIKTGLITTPLSKLLKYSGKALWFITKQSFSGLTGLIKTSSSWIMKPFVKAVPAQPIVKIVQETAKPVLFKLAKDINPFMNNTLDLPKITKEVLDALKTIIFKK